VSISTIDDRTLEIADEDLVVSLKDGRKIVTLLVVPSTLPCHHAGPEQRR
jgi:hypothetical protein